MRQLLYRYEKAKLNQCIKTIQTREEIKEDIKKYYRKYNIYRELDKIYRERKRWNSGKGPFTPSEIKKRESILLKQQLLCMIAVIVP